MNVRVALTGFGNVGQGLATLLRDRNHMYEDRYGVRFDLTAVRDRGGAVVDPAGLSAGDLLAAKRERGTVSGAGGEAAESLEAFLDGSKAHVLVEAASTNFVDAEPGWSYVRGALGRGMDVVLASKGSLALHWTELMDTAASTGRQVLFSATVGSPVPSLQLAERVLVGADVLGFEGILNSTTHVILTAMSDGVSYEEGVRRAQEMGMAETDPTLDVDGWDAAAKVLIVANAVFGSALRIEDVRREGIRGVGAEDLKAAREAGKAIKLIGRARPAGGKIEASVGPEARSLNDPLGRLTGDAMGIVFETEPLGKMAATVEPAGGHSGGITTAMTVIRDLLNLSRDRGWARHSRG